MLCCIQKPFNHIMCISIVVIYLQFAPFLHGVCKINLCVVHQKIQIIDIPLPPTRTPLSAYTRSNKLCIMYNMYVIVFKWALSPLVVIIQHMGNIPQLTEDSTETRSRFTSPPFYQLGQLYIATWSSC